MSIDISVHNNYSLSYNHQLNLINQATLYALFLNFNLNHDIYFDESFFPPKAFLELFLSM